MDKSKRTQAAQEVIDYVQQANAIIRAMRVTLDHQQDTIADLFNKLATLEERVQTLESG